jgi:hypothetical protein
VLPEHREHAALFIAREMKKAVPRDDGIEPEGQDEPAHIRFDPQRLRSLHCPLGPDGEQPDRWGAGVDK